MASSFRIRLKMPTRAEADDADGHIQPDSSPRAGQASSVLDDGSSMMSVDDAAEESDELEDSPPPQPPPKQLKGSPAGRKLSGAAAMKAANNLKRSKLATGKLDDDGEGGSSEGYGKRSRTASNNVAASPSHSRSSPTPPGLAAARAAAIASFGAVTSAKRRSFLVEFGKPIEEMSLSEIEGLPAAKRRKGLKARGASGPGRGWRKGLKMDQKPVYRQPGDTPPAAVAPDTPSSFARPKSALGRDALSKASTPFRSESPFSRESSTSFAGVGPDEQGLGQLGEGPQSVAQHRTLSASHAAVAARRARANGGDNGSTSLPAVQSRTSTPLPAPSAAPALIAAPVKASVPTKEDEGRAIKAIIRGGPVVLAVPRIPIGFVTVTPLDRSGSSRPARKWQRRAREVLSLGGRPWSAVSWISGEQSQFSTATSTGTEMKTTSSNLGTTANAASEMDRSAMSGHQSVMTGVGSALTTAPGSGNITPALASGTATPVPGTGARSAYYLAEATTRAATANVPAVSTGASIPSPHTSTPNVAIRTKQQQQPTSASPPSATAGPSAAPTPAADWKGSSAAFAAANRGRL